MTDPKSSALIPLEAHLSNLANLADFIAKSVEIQKVLPSIVNWEQAWPEAKSATQAFVKVPLDFDQILYNSCYLSMISCYEEFVRRVIAIVAENFIEDCSEFDRIPVELSQFHLVSSAKLLTRFYNPPQQLHTTNFWDVAKKLGTWFPSAPRVEVNSDAVSLGVDLLSITDVCELCVKFGQPITLDTLGSDSALANALSLPTGRNAGKELQKVLSEIAKRRNRIAHTGNSADVTRQLFLEHLSFLGVFAKAIAGRVAIPVKKGRKATA